MSFDMNGPDISLVAGADLSASQFRAVKLNSSGQVVRAGDGEFAIGILQNKPTSGQAATVRSGSGWVSKAVAGGSVTAGSPLKSSADGRLVAAVAGRTNTSDAGASADALIGSHVLAQAIEGGAAGDVIAVLISHSGAIPTTAA